MKHGARLLCLAALVGGLATMPAAHAASARPARSSYAGGILSQLNAVRRAHGLTTLRASASLTAAAHAHSVEMVADGYFAHSSNDGAAFWHRVQSYYGGPSAVGENLLWASPRVSARRVIELWMASPEHRVNVLDPLWREIGIGVAHSAHAPGWYHGQAVTVVTTDFGARV